jgi:glycosyltransferase involved in cell wall biosynthesis
MSQRALDVGFLCQGWAPDAGGIETHTMDLARELMRRGHELFVLCLDTTPGLEPYSVCDGTHAGVAVRRMAYAYQDQTSLADVVSNPRADAVVMAWMAERPCDVIHVHHLTGFGADALRAIEDMGRPLVMTLHDYWLLCPRGQMLRAGAPVCAPVCATLDPSRCGECIAETWPHLMPARGLEARAADARARTAVALAALSLPGRLLAPSQTVLDVYAACGVDTARGQVIEHGFDADAIARDVAARRALAPRSDGDLRLGVLGTVQPSKGQLELARAVCASEIPELTLEVHGELAAYHGDTSYADALRATAAAHDRIRLHGSYARTDLARVLAGLDGVAAPSLWNEPYGLTVREARACGLPVLVADRGGLPPAAQAGLAGLTLPAGDPAAWQRALVRFAAPSERARWSAQPHALASADEMALAVERCYFDVIDAVS